MNLEQLENIAELTRASMPNTLSPLDVIELASSLNIKLVNVKFKRAGISSIIKTSDDEEGFRYKMFVESARPSEQLRADIILGASHLLLHNYEGRPGNVEYVCETQVFSNKGQDLKFAFKAQLLASMILIPREELETLPKRLMKNKGFLRNLFVVPDSVIFLRLKSLTSPDDKSAALPV